MVLYAKLHPKRFVMESAGWTVVEVPKFRKSKKIYKKTDCTLRQEICSGN
jgi:hypothetical protein